MNKAAMNSFDLRKVRELMSFQDLFRTDSSYMPEAKCLNRVELDAEPLYEIVTKTEVLFTAKLLYYRLLVANEVNRHINDAVKLSDEDSTGYLAQYLLKNTFEAVQTLMHEANDRLAEVDCGGTLWQDITSTSPRIEASVRGRMEETVFIHDVFAELARCWLELQDRFENTSNGIGSYTAALLYSSCISRMPDEEFKLRRTEKYDVSTKTKKNIYPDCCFLYDCEDDFNDAIQCFTNKLKKYKLIPIELDYKQMMSLFRGRPCRYTYRWLGQNCTLTHIIKGLCDGHNPIITTWPSGTSKWEVVSARFVDKEGTPLPHIGQERLRKRQQAMIDEIVAAFAGNPR